MQQIPDLSIHVQQGALTRLCFLADTAAPRADSGCARDIADVRIQLNHWFRQPDTIFTFPLAPKGTVFQQTVWRALQQIPAGEIRTYGELASQLGTHPRAIGQACRSNPLPIVIPCHRVVAKQQPGGFMGCTDGYLHEIKLWLLALEKRQSVL